MGTNPLSPFPNGFSILGISSSTISSGYNVFRKVVCLSSPSLMASAIADVLISSIQAVIEDVRSKIVNGITQRLADLKAWYWNLIINTTIKFGVKKYNIFDIIEVLDTFAGCALGVCDYTSSSVKDVDEALEKTMVSRLNGIYSLDTSKYEKDLSTKLTKAIQDLDYFEEKVMESAFRRSMEKLSINMNKSPDSYPTQVGVNATIESEASAIGISDTNKLYNKVTSAVASIPYEANKTSAVINKAVDCSGQSSSPDQVAKV